jgi:hypothetical protein
MTAWNVRRTDYQIAGGKNHVVRPGALAVRPPRDRLSNASR